MGLENARDSFVDLLLIKEEKQELQRLIEEGNVGQRGGDGSSSPSNRSLLKQQTSFRVKRGAVKKGNSSHAALATSSSGFGDGVSGGSSGRAPSDNNSQSQSLSGAASYEDLFYEPCEVEGEEEEHWPVWEMSVDDPWADNPNPNGNSDGNKNMTSAAAAAPTTTSSLSEGGNSNDNFSIGECERIFTVPEVYDEMQGAHHTRMSQVTLRDDVSVNGSDNENDNVPCQSILNCLMPWKQWSRTSFNNEPFVPQFGRLSTITELSREDSENTLCPKGVMKRSSMAVQIYLGMPVSVRRSFTPSMFKVQLDDDDDNAGNVLDEISGEEGSSSSRRKRVSIVGSDQSHKYTMGMDAIIAGMKQQKEQNNNNLNNNNKKKYKVHFSELKRVLRVRKFTPDEAVEVWFQRADFGYFKNEMTLLIQEEGASREVAEVWLEAARSSQASEASTNDEKEEGADSSGCAVAQHNDNGHSRDDSATSTGSGEGISRSSRAWWHDYDHSRRGLERYASPGQARQILASYKVAVTKVLQEQQRQTLLKCLCIPGAQDPEKIAEVYHEYTAWSRDLALAAGASDADAVRTNFDDDKRHTREYYMLKQVVNSGYKVHKHMPRFMLPKCIVPKGFLDEAETLYLNLGDARSHNAASGVTASSLFVSMVQNATAAQSRKPISGEEAREEMSRLNSKDLEGPVAPALVPSLQGETGSVKSDNNSNNNNGNGIMASPRQQEKRKKMKKRTSLAEKAKNYPFQQ